MVNSSRKTMRKQHNIGVSGRLAETGAKGARNKMEDSKAGLSLVHRYEDKTPKFQSQPGALRQYEQASADDPK